MLREIKETGQRRGERKKRWFSNSNMDLFIWFDDDDEIVSYQLTYDKPNAEKALTWSAEHGFSHTGVDDGTRPGKHPGSPLLVANGAFEAAKILALLKENSGELHPSVTNFIVLGIEEYFL